MTERPGPPHVARYHGLLGTVVEVRVHSDDAEAAKGFDGVACLIVDAAGTVTTSQVWPRA